MLIWIIAAVLLIILEVMTQMLWALCLTAGCVGAIVAALCGASFPWQFTVMGIVSVVAYPIVLPSVKKWHDRQMKREGREARTGMDALLGRKAVVTNEIRPGETGRVRIDGDNWQAVAPGVNFTIHKGTETVVTAYDSIILTVALPDGAPSADK